MIVIKSHHHTKNSGFGNKLFLTSFAESYAIETGQPVFNWLVTDILHGGDRDGVLSKDNKGVEWRHLPNIAVNDEEASIVGKGTNLSSHEFHQTANDVELIKKHKNLVVKDFGHREGVFVHVRAPDKNRRWKNRVPGVEYYKKALSASCSGYVSSNDPNHPTVRYLLDHFDLKIYEKGLHDPEDSIIFGSTFDNKVLSLGTFSWWIGFIGNQNNVICPNPSNYTKWHGPIFEQMKEWTKI